MLPVVADMFFLQMRLVLQIEELVVVHLLHLEGALDKTVLLAALVSLLFGIKSPLFTH
jgi:hypothetical protein